MRARIDVNPPASEVMSSAADERSDGSSRRLSIAVICYSYPPVLGGSEIEVQRVCAMLQKRGHAVEVLCAGGDPMPRLTRWVDPVGVPVRLFGGRLSHRWRGHAYALGVAWTLLRNAHKYDVVYFLMTGLHIATGLPVAHWLRKPVIMKFSGSNLIRQMTHTRLGRLELKFIHDWAQRILILNPGMVEEALEVGLGDEKLMWMPNPVDTERFRPLGTSEKIHLRQQLGLPEQAFIIVSVGRLAPEKELPSLLQAFAGIGRANPDALLVLVGDGPDRQNLEALARDLGPVQIRFVGRKPDSEVPLWLQASDAFALVSSLEGLPCALIEAMAAGLPPVVSDIPANTQLVTADVDGLIVPLREIVSMAAAFGRLMQDEELRRRLGTQARTRVVQTFSNEIVAALYEKLFFSTLAATT